MRRARKFGLGKNMISYLSSSKRYWLKKKLDFTIIYIRNLIKKISIFFYKKFLKNFFNKLFFILVKFEIIAFK